MSGDLRALADKTKSPWRLSVLSAMAMPLFPEFVAPILAVFSLITAWLDARRCGRGLRIKPLGWVLLVFVLYTGVGALYSETTLISVGTWLLWCCMFLVYLAMANVLTDRGRFNTALFTMTVVAGIVGGIACVQYVANALVGFSLPWCVWQWLEEFLYANFPLSLSLGARGVRACSTFSNPNLLAEYLTMVFPFTIYSAFVGRRTRAQIGCRVCLLLAAGGIAFSFSRGSYIALALIVAVLCITNAKKIVLILLGFSAAVTIIPESVLARLFSFTNTGVDASVGERMDIWQICLEAIRERPVFGYGPGVQNSWELIVAGGINAPHAHNLVLQLLIEGGMIALVLMLFLGGRVFAFSVRLARHPSHSQEVRMLGILFVTFVLAFCAESLVEYPFLTPKLVMTFTTILGMADATRQVYMDESVSQIGRFLRRCFSRLPLRGAKKPSAKKYDGNGCYFLKHRI